MRTLDMPRNETLRDGHYGWDRRLRSLSMVLCYIRLLFRWNHFDSYYQAQRLTGLNHGHNPHPVVRPTSKAKEHTGISRRMCGDCCGQIVYGLMCCFLPCYTKRSRQHATSCDQEEAPRPVKLQSRVHEWNATAIEAPLQKRVSARQAHSQLLANLSHPLNGKQTAALFRLRMAFSTREEHLSSEFFALVIKDLDTVLFSGSLDGRILVDWVDMPATSRRILQGISLPQGFSKISKVRIRLNTAMLGTELKEDIWGAVLHEMVHAYLALMSGWRGMLMKHHGSPFEECCKAVVGRLALEGLEVHHVV